MRPSRCELPQRLGMRSKRPLGTGSLRAAHHGSHSARRAVNWSTALPRSHALSAVSASAGEPFGVVMWKYAPTRRTPVGLASLDFEAVLAAEVTVRRA